jgi:hypothetical protein
MDKSMVAIVILLLAILSLVFLYSFEELGDSGNRTELTVYSEGPIPLSKIILDVKNNSYYQGYDNETLAWMESLGDKQVFSGNGTFVVMSSYDAGKLHSEYVCDAYIEEFFECEVIETHSLGDVEFPREIIYVKNVKYIGEEIHGLQGS